MPFPCHEGKVDTCDKLLLNIGESSGRKAVGGLIGTTGRPARAVACTALHRAVLSRWLPCRVTRQVPPGHPPAGHVRGTPGTNPLEMGLRCFCNLMHLHVQATCQRTCPCLPFAFLLLELPQVEPLHLLRGAVFEPWISPTPPVSGQTVAITAVFGKQWVKLCV